ncbi:MAG: dynamin family protein [Desulfovibrionaceae bacterium]|nr:dynamin family protein [Desulfovibrionaceae bacterium]
MNFTETYTTVAEYFQNTAEEREKLNKIKEQHEDSAIRIAIVGGFSQGKTYFVNKLLDVDCFPTSVTPETALIYEIAYGDVAGARRSVGGVDETLPLTSEALANMSASKQEFTANDCVHVFLPNELLKDHLILYDTPGIDDILASRAVQALSLLDQCDAAIVVISAIAPLSLLERKFIETYLVHRAIPRLAILVNFCEKVPEKSLDKQLDFIQKRAQTICPKAELWKFSEDASQVAYTAKTLDDIRERLRSWCQEIHNEDRDERDRITIRSLLEQYKNTLESRLEMLKGDHEVCKKQLNAAIDALESENDTWRTLLSAFLNRGNDLACALTKKVDDLAGEIVTDSKGDCAIREQIHTKLGELRETVRTTIANQIRLDLQDFCSNIKKTFGFSMTLDEKSLPDCQFTMDIPLFPAEAQETNDLQILGFEGATILNTILAFFIKDPRTVEQLCTPIIATLKGILNGVDDHQRDIEYSIQKCTGTLNLAITQNVRTLYEESAKQLRQSQKIWYAEQKESIAQIQESEDINNQIHALETSYSDLLNILQRI